MVGLHAFGPRGCHIAQMMDVPGYALLVGGVCMAANAIVGLTIVGLIGLADRERRVRNAVPAVILAALAPGGYALLLD